MKNAKLFDYHGLIKTVTEFWASPAVKKFSTKKRREIILPLSFWLTLTKCNLTLDIIPCCEFMPITALGALVAHISRLIYGLAENHCVGAGYLNRTEKTAEENDVKRNFNVLEKSLFEIIGEIVGLASISAIKLATQLYKKFGVNIPVKNF